MKVHTLAIALVFFSVNGLHAQHQSVRTFSARVIDRTNHDPIPFATVQMEGTKLSALTDMDGLFSLMIPVCPSTERCHLTINSMGYQPRRFPVPRSDKGRLGKVRLKRIKFDLRSIEQVQDDKDGTGPLREK